MQKVQGIGGVFFRAKGPAALTQWYLDHLGINPVPQSMDDMPWSTDAGVTIFAPFPADTDYFPADKAFKLNFRVADLDAMVAQLRTAGIDVQDGENMPGIGRFAHLADPEGTPIELWQPETA